MIYTANESKYSAFGAINEGPQSAMRSVRDDQGSGLVAAEEIRVGTHEGPAAARFSVHGFTSAVIGHCRQVRGRSAAAPRLPGSVLVSFTPLRGRSPASAGRLSVLVRTFVDASERWCAVLESV